MRIALCAQAVKLGDEKEGLDRVHSIALALRDADYDVELITSNFQHWRKEHRETWRTCYDTLGYDVTFLDEIGYAKNLDLQRIKSHALLAKALSAYLGGHRGEYELIYSIVPPNDYARAAAEFAKSEGIPFIVDVSDLWPEAMRMALDVPVVSDILFSGFSRDAKAVYRMADGAIGTSDEYAMRPLADRKGLPKIPHKTVYVGNDLKRFDAGVAANASKIHKESNELWVTYAGTIGKSYDLATLVDAIAADEKIAEKYGYKLRGKILGGGPDEEELSRRIAESGAPVDMVGYVAYEEMAAWLSKSDILVNSLVANAPQSIVSKVADYLAAGKPMINTGPSREFKDKVVNDGFGKNVNAGDATALAESMEELIRQSDRRKILGMRAREVAEQQFDRSRSYKQIPELVEEVLDAAAKPLRSSC